jgi:DNA-binding NarL/FixJ family response regulator
VSAVLIVDDAVALAELFASAVRDQLGHDVTFVAAPDLVGAALQVGSFDLALIDLSFPGTDASGLDVLAEIHAASPGTRLVVYTQGDAWVAQLLRDAWELLPVATVMSKSSPLSLQLGVIQQVLRDGTAPIDPVIQPLVPSRRSPLRTAERFEKLVQHVGHAKLWSALMASHPNASYREIAEATGLKLNTVKNYRAQLVGELAIHGLDDPGLAEMREFAVRCRPFLRPWVESAMERAG